MFILEENTGQQQHHTDFSSEFLNNCYKISAEIVGSPQVSFLMCTLEIPQKNCSTSSLLLTLFTFTFEPFLKL